MAQDFNFEKRPSGSEKKNEPKVIGEVLNEYFRSNEPLAVALRDRLFKDFFPDTYLDVDLKVITREPGRLPIGEMVDGVIRHDDENHFTFVQNNPEKKVVSVRRNPVIYSGGCINVHKLADGTLRLEFNRPRFYPAFSFRDFCMAAAQELLTIARLLGEEDSEE